MSDPERRAVVLIPGLERVERFERRDLLAENLANTVAQPTYPAEPVMAAGEAGLRLRPRALRGDERPGRTLDLFEAYWADMVPSSAEMSPWRRFVSGFELVAYWLFSWGNLKALRLSRAIAIGLVAGGVLLVLWYVSIAVIVVAALRAAPEQEMLLASLPALRSLFDWLLDVTAWVQTSAPYFILTLLLSAFRADELAQMAMFSKEYLENRRRDMQAGLRDRVRRRVAETIDHVLASSYDEVFVVAHSFGSIIAIDLLARWPHPADRDRVHLITLGSPEAVLSCRSQWLAGERERLFRNAPHAWLDFYSPTDWLCNAITDHARHYPGNSHRLWFDAPLIERATGRTHKAYYFDPEVLQTLMGGSISARRS
ncbi:hypothetical protein DFR31_0515 [Alkalispirillum mobile]|uniref:Uncharacterized protein n=1 Tax=Alkalispirillum mobile TaxID=85925 RepID=A0A498C6D0_9GAMM|nr:hypothetical protein [Alkalispirillum mobile]RLK50609.1 hypothetical protein DFR31_0515 [Alkalispirillum mobile]